MNFVGFVNHAERLTHGAAVVGSRCKLTVDVNAAALDVDGTLVPFGVRRFDEVRRANGLQIFTADGFGAVSKFAAEEELVVHRFKDTDRNIGARPHERIPALHETGGDDTHAGVLHERCRRCHAAHRVTGNTYFGFVNLRQIVQIFCAVIHAGSVHHRAAFITCRQIIAMTFTVDSQHDETSAGKFDGVLQLQLSVVEIAVRQNDRRFFVAGGSVFRHKQYTADNFAFDFCGRCLTCFFVDEVTAVRRVAQIGHTDFIARRLNHGSEETANKNHRQHYDQHQQGLLVFSQILHKFLLKILYYVFSQKTRKTFLGAHASRRRSPPGRGSAFRPALPKNHFTLCGISPCRRFRPSRQAVFSAFRQPFRV